MDYDQIEALLSEVKTWLTEEGMGRYAWCRAAKLELLMKHGMVTPAEAIDCWELSEMHEVKGREN